MKRNPIGIFPSAPGAVQMSVRLSAVVATRNRASYLQKALNSLSEQTLDPSLFEIIVVDNGSRDDTSQVATGHFNISNFRYIYEPVVGVSRARNTGWSNAEGSYVVFMDDDAVAHADWLERFLEAFDSYGHDVGSIGGKVEPLWEAPRPNWLSDKMLEILSIYHYSDEPVILSEKQGLSICNMGFPKWVLQEMGGLREDLGRKGDKLLADAEDYLNRQLRIRGLSSIYHPGIVVGHSISSSRLTKKWFRRQAYWHGFSEAVMINPTGRLSRRERGRFALARLSWLMPRLFLATVGRGPANRFRRQCQSLEAVGYIAGMISSVA